MCGTREGATRAERQVIDDENDGEPERYKFDWSLSLRYDDTHVLLLILLIKNHDIFWINTVGIRFLLANIVCLWDEDDDND